MERYPLLANFDPSFWIRRDSSSQRFCEARFEMEQLVEACTKLSVDSRPSDWGGFAESM